MRDRIKDILNSFFISVTLINAAMLILGKFLRPNQTFGYEVFMYPLLYGLVGTIPSIIVGERKELSVRQVLVRKAIQLVLLTVLLLVVIFGGTPMNADNISAAIGVAISVVVIYVLVHLILWWLDLRKAKDLTEDLLKFQRRQTDNSV